MVKIEFVQHVFKIDMVIQLFTILSIAASKTYGFDTFESTCDERGEDKIFYALICEWKVFAVLACVTFVLNLAMDEPTRAKPGLPGRPYHLVAPYNYVFLVLITVITSYIISYISLVAEDYTPGILF